MLSGQGGGGATCGVALAHLVEDASRFQQVDHRCAADPALAALTRGARVNAMALAR